MMGHDGWMAGWGGGSMWLLTVLGALVVVLLVALVMRVARKQGSN